MPRPRDLDAALHVRELHGPDQHGHCAWCRRFSGVVATAPCTYAWAATSLLDSAC